MLLENHERAFVSLDREGMSEFGTVTVREIPVVPENAARMSGSASKILTWLMFVFVLMKLTTW